MTNQKTNPLHSRFKRRRQKKIDRQLQPKIYFIFYFIENKVQIGLFFPHRRKLNKLSSSDALTLQQSSEGSSINKHQSVRHKSRPSSPPDRRRRDTLAAAINKAGKGSLAARHARVRSCDVIEYTWMGGAREQY